MDKIYVFVSKNILDLCTQDLSLFVPFYISTDYSCKYFYPDYSMSVDNIYLNIYIGENISKQFYSSRSVELTMDLSYCRVLNLKELITLIEVIKRCKSYSYLLKLLDIALYSIYE